MDGKFYTIAGSILLLLLFPACIFAQNAQSDGITIEVQARVLTSLDIVTIRNIGFSQVQSGQQEIRIDPTVDQNAGKLKVTGPAGSEINISFIDEQQLQQVNGNAVINFRYIISGNNRDEQLSSELVDFDNRTAVLNEQGTYFIWVGGIANVENIRPGQYLGDFTLEIEHN